MKINTSDRVQAKRLLRANMKIDKKTGCWIWQGGPRHVYGAVTIFGKTKSVHRVAFELWIGKIPEGLIIRHTCDVKSCFNPKHLIPGTHEDNMRDCRERIVPGTAIPRNPNSVVLQVTFGRKLMSMIDELIEIGFFGNSRPAVIERLASEAIRSMKRDRSLDLYKKASKGSLSAFLLDTRSDTCKIANRQTTD